MKKLSVISIAILMLIHSIVFANPQNPQNPQDANSQKNTKHMLLANSPPGLQKKGYSGVPYSGKVPPGWDQGVKRGWNKDKNWHWNKETHYWESKDWQWNTKSDSWQRNHSSNH